jgi:hypothetical protein
LAGEFQETLKLLEANGLFLGVKSFIDLGSGHGIYAIGFVRPYPGLKGTVFDLPRVILITQKFLAAYGMEDKIKTIAGDLYRDAIPGKYGLAFMSNVSPTREEAQTVFRKVFDALEEGGKLVVKDMIPHRDWSGSFYQLAHQLIILIHQGDPDEFAPIPTAERLIGIMRDTGFANSRFPG